MKQQTNIDMSNETFTKGQLMTMAGNLNCDALNKTIEIYGYNYATRKMKGTFEQMNMVLNDLIAQKEYTKLTAVEREFIFEDARQNARRYYNETNGI